jgi:hypothetical protein
MNLLRRYRYELLISLIAVLTYAISIFNNFHTDDWLVLNNLRDGFSWQDFLSMENPARFRPLTNLLLYFRYLAFKDTVSVYYLLNIILHAAFCILLFRFLKKINIKPITALLSALFFGVYFQHYEAVLWLYGTIRIFGAIFWILSLWTLYDFYRKGSLPSFVTFAVVSFLGLFIVEDMVVMPLGCLLFLLLVNDAEIPQKRIWQIISWAGVNLLIYFLLRSFLITRPGVTEEYYYLGFHVFSRLWAYLQWMIIPPPDHPYFHGLAMSLNPVISGLWRWVSILSTIAFILILLAFFFKGKGAIRFFVIFIFLTLLPALPLNYKVTSRNIYIPSIGLAVLAGYFITLLLEKFSEKAISKKLIYLFLGFYIIINIVAVGTTSLQYHKNQQLVSEMISDLKSSGIELNKFRYVLLDNLPGRSVVGPAMIYMLNFRNEVIASNDPVSGPVDIKAAARDIQSKGITFVVFDYQDGHLIEDTRDYLPR